MYSMRDFADAVADVYSARYGPEWLQAANFGFGAAVNVDMRPELWADVIARAEFNSEWSEAIAWHRAFLAQLHDFNVWLPGGASIVVQATDLMHAWRVAQMACGLSVVDVNCRPECYTCRQMYTTVREVVSAASTHDTAAI